MHPLPGALVVNVGDVLTNGAYASVKHMVVLDAERSRTTVAMFHDACVGGLVTPLPELLRGCDTRPRYRYIRKLEYRNGSTGALAQRRRYVDGFFRYRRTQLHTSNSHRTNTHTCVSIYTHTREEIGEVTLRGKAQYYSTRTLVSRKKILKNSKEFVPLRSNPRPRLEAGATEASLQGTWTS